ncbi:hypothetical protein Hanom_Chr05g00435271 [Helianthus anomalus]
MIEIPYIFLQTIVYLIIVYAMIGFEWTTVKTPNHNFTAIISWAFYAIWNLFSVFIVPRTRIPVWWRWYYYICLLHGQYTDWLLHMSDCMDTC